MKVIDLLNKIANGEEAPKEIRYRDENLYFDYETSNYYNDEDMHSLFCEVQFILNNEVELIEEDKEIEEYILKTIISFISLNAVIYITKDNWKKLKPKRNGFIKRNIFKLSLCLVPVIRWIWVVLILVYGICLSDDEFVKLWEEAKEKKGK